MLKSLEMVGFKSFAEKTMLAFPPGMTVVVGPNGSGKSNIVDAIKWVLGAQSVKSLRGKEMTDVIFNGSASRLALNTCEVTVTFDNEKHLLAVDTPEVQITRRIYRSGEGEYMINRQPCRLRDIRDLFAGTGIATDAYSVIEQGKVDIMLQSSPKDRRAIFEEAAGISRFKAKKIEATRRLERVDQNLLRLSDIVDEVENRLRSVRSQATKARRYQEYADRLQELRTHVGLTDWRALTEKLDKLQTSLTTLSSDRDSLAARTEAIEAESLEFDTQIGKQNEAIRESEARVAENREQIAACETTIEHERRLSHDLDEEATRHRRQLAAMSSRAGNLGEHLRETTSAVEAATLEYDEVRRHLDDDKQALAELSERLDELRQRSERQRTEHMDKMRDAGTLGNRISGLESQLEAAELAGQRCDEQIAEIDQSRKQLGKELAGHRQKLSKLDQRYSRCSADFEEGSRELAQSRRRLARGQKDLAQLQGRHTGAVERATVLEELERRLEGLSSGVKEALVKAREAVDGPFRQVRGLVADLLHVNVETAPLVEVALGELAQYLVVAPGREMLEYLEGASARFAGRVGFIRMDARLPASPVDRIDLEGEPGVLGRADRFVETSAEFAPLAKRLLGRTWFVEDLAQAVALSESKGRGLNFVTLAGELVSESGAVAVGPIHASTGLISRRSELRALEGQIKELEARIAEGEASTSQLEEQTAVQDKEVQKLTEEHTMLSDVLGDQRLKTASAEDRQAQCERQFTTLQTEADAAKAQHLLSSEQLLVVHTGRKETEEELARLETEIETDSREVDRLDAERDGRQNVAVDRQVQLAKSEQRLEGLRGQMAQIEQDQQERTRGLSESQSHLDQCLARADQSRRLTLQAESRVAELYLSREKVAETTVTHINRREELGQQRMQLATEVQEIRHRLRSLEKKIHEEELVASQLHHERTTLAERLREDYEIDLADARHEPSAEELRERKEVEQEIADLRKKINNIGGVNLEALGELDELDVRFQSLSSQYEDLSKAKVSLEQIIDRINDDSRRMFAETLEVVRGHFQSLFRKLFGGGQADIILDDDEDTDVLESGIEIVAHPPGKEPRSISLLSGGEKTLTCVALLLSIFRSRPSPFCVLDEVDAALDEINIERFTGVLTEFLSSTQFIVITHSKKTMTAADTLYGVTMQESGVSKRVSVRFEDVSEDGEIRESAVRASMDEEAQQKADASDDETQAA